MRITKKTKTIIIDTTIHEGNKVVLIKFSDDAELCIIVKKLTEVQWSESIKAWYVPHSSAALNAIKQVFGDYCIIDAGSLKEKIKSWLNSSKK